MSKQGREPEVSKEDILTAVRTMCEKNGTPMVPTPEVEKYEELSVSSQTVLNHLKDLAEDEKLIMLEPRGYVWGIPDNEEISGEVDFSNINWDAVDPEDIPPEKIDAHPDVEIQTFWERFAEKSATVFSSAFGVFLVGLLIIWIDVESSTIEISSQLGEVGALALIGGFVFMVLGIGGMVLARFGKELADRGLHELLRAGFNRLKSRIHSGIPITISRDEGSITVSWDSSRTKEEEE